MTVGDRPPLLLGDGHPQSTIWSHRVISQWTHCEINVSSYSEYIWHSEITMSSHNDANIMRSQWAKSVPLRWYHSEHRYSKWERWSHTVRPNCGHRELILYPSDELTILDNKDKGLHIEAYHAFPGMAFRMVKFYVDMTLKWWKSWIVNT